MRRLLANANGDGMKHFATLALSVFVLFITLLCGVSMGLYLDRRFVCQALADAMELSAWDTVCEELPDKEEAQEVRKGES
jgi:hypothetical protein